MEVPENWNRVTPALAGRRSARGIPNAIAITAMVISVGTIFGLKNYVGYWVAVGFGCFEAIVIIGSVKLLAPADRDWFDILCELINHKFEIAMFKLWEWRYKW